MVKWFEIIDCNEAVSSGIGVKLGSLKGLLLIENWAPLMFRWPTSRMAKEYFKYFFGHMIYL